MRCDTCRREVPEVSRVVIYEGYNRIASKAIYNCPECFAKKEKTKPYNLPASKRSSEQAGKPRSEKEPKGD